MQTTLFCLSAGFYFALLQFSYFFLLEAFLSSQHISYFLVLFLWLSGFLGGLNIKRKNLLMILFINSLAGYYISYILISLFPFNGWLYPAAGFFIVISGLLPGYFFPYAYRHFTRAKYLLFHENNGFIAGMLISLIGSVYAGKWFLALAPIAGAIFIGLSHNRITAICKLKG